MIRELYYSSWNYVTGPLRRAKSALLKQQRITVLVYHRVDDSFQDPLTVSVDQFDRHCQLLSENYSVISLKDACSLDSYESAKPQIVITFDDGYECNHRSAMPILLKYNLPASFFVSSGFVGTKRMFEHDKAYYKDPIKVLDWDQVSELHANGFNIGSHTVNHLRCSKLGEYELEYELRESKRVIEERLNTKIEDFAFPFGGQKDFPFGKRGLLKRVGYKTCLSAYGESNTVPINKYDIRRFGVDYNFIEAAFKARVEGYQLREEPR